MHIGVGGPGSRLIQERLGYMDSPLDGPYEVCKTIYVNVETTLVGQALTDT